MRKQEQEQEMREEDAKEVEEGGAAGYCSSSNDSSKQQQRRRRRQLAARSEGERMMPAACPFFNKLSAVFWHGIFADAAVQRGIQLELQSCLVFGKFGWAQGHQGIDRNRAKGQQLNNTNDAIDDRADGGLTIIEGLKGYTNQNRTDNRVVCTVYSVSNLAAVAVCGPCVHMSNLRGSAKLCYRFL